MTPEERPVEARIRDLEARVHALRRALLRTAVLLVGGLIGAGLVLPVLSEEIDGSRTTLRTATAWWTTLGDPGPEGEGALVVLGIGFSGLLVVALLALLSLAEEVHAGRGSSRLDRARGWVAGLLVSGSVVPLLLWIAASASAADGGSEEPGWGAVLLLLGAVGYAVLVTRRGSRDLWVDVPGPDRFRSLD